MQLRIPVYMLASSPGRSQILSRSRGEKSGKAWDQNYVTTGNGGLGYYGMWTRFCNDGNVPTQYAAGGIHFECHYVPRSRRAPRRTF